MWWLSHCNVGVQDIACRGRPCQRVCCLPAGVSFHEQVGWKWDCSCLLCRYCGTTRNLTIDHIIPKSKGGTWVWENLVTACQKCNGKKGEKTLKQMKWKLKREPKVPLIWDAPSWRQEMSGGCLCNYSRGKEHANQIRILRFLILWGWGALHVSSFDNSSCGSGLVKT